MYICCHLPTLMHSCRASKDPSSINSTAPSEPQPRSHLQEPLPSRLNKEAKNKGPNSRCIYQQYLCILDFTSASQPYQCMYAQPLTLTALITARAYTEAPPTTLSDILHTTYDIRHTTPAQEHPHPASSGPKSISLSTFILILILILIFHTHHTAKRESFPRFPPSTTPRAQDRETCICTSCLGPSYIRVSYSLVSSMYSVACMYSYLMYARTRHVCHRRLAPQLCFTYMHLIPGSRVSPCKSCPTSTSTSPGITSPCSRANDRVK
ncbi:hypothetical protein CI102_6593 [Trichoderma harzianum]|nr:hypothetical protein CI102_6593 [Trichoderma harzianum]